VNIRTANLMIFLCSELSTVGIQLRTVANSSALTIRRLLHIQAMRKSEKDKRMLRRRAIVAALDEEPEVCIEIF
jgi:hypothetical protein